MTFILFPSSSHCFFFPWYEVEFIIRVLLSFPSYLIFIVSVMFKVLHGRTSLSGLSHTLPQFGIIWSSPVICKVTCLVIWQMLRRSNLVLYSQWLLLALGHEWNQKIRQVSLTSSFWVKTIYRAVPLFHDYESAVFCLITSDHFSTLISKGTVLIYYSSPIKSHLEPKTFRKKWLSA